MSFRYSFTFTTLLYLSSVSILFLLLKLTATFIYLYFLFFFPKDNKKDLMSIIYLLHLDDSVILIHELTPSSVCVCVYTVNGQRLGCCVVQRLTEGLFFNHFDSIKQFYPNENPFISYSLVLMWHFCLFIFPIFTERMQSIESQWIGWLE